VPADVIALEASGTQIEYITEAGTVAVKDQPKGYAQVMASPDRDEWLDLRHVDVDDFDVVLVAVRGLDVPSARGHAARSG
jgi:carbamate kinase